MTAANAAARATRRRRRRPSGAADASAPATFERQYIRTS